MAYPYYAPYARPMGYYNPSIPNMADNQTMQSVPQFQQMPIQQQSPMQMVGAQMSLPNQQVSDLLFVLNETEATAYPVAPNNSVTLWDKNKDTVYIKSVNAQGVPSMRILDYTERMSDNASRTPDKHTCQCGKDFVRVEVFERLQSDLEALRGELEELKIKPKAKPAKKAVEEVEDNG